MSDKKQLSESDRNEITNVLNGVAYLMDTRSYDRLGQAFSADMRFENPGRLAAEGLPAVIESFKKITDPSLSHHITNVVLTANDDGTVRAVSKALTIRSDKSLVAAEYTDILKKTEAGWRISSRTIKRLT